MPKRSQKHNKNSSSQLTELAKMQQQVQKTLLEMKEYQDQHKDAMNSLNQRFETELS